jgi:glycosyltransferase involved in cell wall biosynthesis
MRVALVVAGPYPAPRGSQVLVSHLADGLAERGHGVHLVTYGADSSAPSGPRARRIARDLLLVGRLWRTVRRQAIDVIHAHNYEAALAGLLVARVTGRPLVYHGHNSLQEELPMYFTSAPMRALARRLGGFLDAHVPRRADFCIAVSDDLAETLRRAGVRPHALACITPAAAPGELGAVPAPGARSDVVCYAGNLDGYQNLAFLVRTFTRVRKRVAGARLLVLTHPDALAGRAHLRTDAPGIEVLAAGTYAEVRARLETAAVAVCPRTERSGFPMKLLSYMAAGKAIVACAGSAKGLRDGITGRVVPDADERAFADAVVELLENAELRARLGAAARRVAEDPGAFARALDRIESIYRMVLAAGASPARALQEARSA